jgi:hypothetical protein
MRGRGIASAEKTKCLAAFSRGSESGLAHQEKSEIAFPYFFPDHHPNTRLANSSEKPKRALARE